MYIHPGKKVVRLVGGRLRGVGVCVCVGVDTNFENCALRRLFCVLI